MAERGRQFEELEAQRVSLATWDWMAQDEAFNRAMIDYVNATHGSKQEVDSIVRIAGILEMSALVVAITFTTSVFDAESYDIALGRLRTCKSAMFN